MSKKEIKNWKLGIKFTKYSDTYCNSCDKELNNEYCIKDHIKYCFPCALQEYRNSLASNLKFQKFIIPSAYILTLIPFVMALSSKPLTNDLILAFLIFPLVCGILLLGYAKMDYQIKLTKANQIQGYLNDDSDLQMESVNTRKKINTYLLLFCVGVILVAIYILFFNPTTKIRLM